MTNDQMTELREKPRDRTEEWLLKACNRATQDYVAQLEQEVNELKGKLEAVTLGSGTCKITATATNNLMYPDYMTKWYELSCGHSLTLKGDEAPRWCAVCGKAVER